MTTSNSEEKVEGNNNKPQNFVAQGWFYFMSFIKSFYRWWDLLKTVLMIVLDIVRKPSFVIFFSIALGVSSVGVWMLYLPEFVEAKGILYQVNEDSLSKSLAIFTFCIAVLGNLATEYIFEEKSSDKENGSVAVHAGFGLWVLAFGFSFICLVSDEYLWYGFSLTVFLWMLTASQSVKFQKANKEVMGNLSGENPTQQIEGKGL